MIKVFHKSLVLFLFIYLTVIAVATGEGIEWERLRLKSSLNINEVYSDNVYLKKENNDRKDDFITKIAPKIAVDLAVAPKNYFTITYRGIYESYLESGNFKKDQHFRKLSFNSETAKGSHFIVGRSVEDTTIQPFSIFDQPKDYTLNEVYANILLVLRKKVEIGTDLSRSERNFIEFKNFDDNYMRDRINVHVLYNYFQAFPLLLQYSYIKQDNNDQNNINSDFIARTIYVGARWQPENKLSGTFRIGYTITKFKEPGVDDFDGFAADTNLNYIYSPITAFRFIIEHGIQTPTRNLKEVGDFYEYTNLGLMVTHQKWEKIKLKLNFVCYFRSYKEILSQNTIRKDNHFSENIIVEYIFRKWIVFDLGFRHQQNNSDDNNEAYKENQIKIGLTINL